MRKLLKKTLAITGCVAMMASMTACEAGDTARGNKADRGNNADRSNGGNRRTGSKGGGRDGSELREHEGCQHKN